MAANVVFDFRTCADDLAWRCEVDECGWRRELDAYGSWIPRRFCVVHRLNVFDHDVDVQSVKDFWGEGFWPDGFWGTDGDTLCRPGIAAFAWDALGDCGLARLGGCLLRDSGWFVDPHQREGFDVNVVGGWI